MTTSIDHDTQDLEAPRASRAQGRSRRPGALITAVRCFTVAAALAGTGLTVADLAGDGAVHLVAAAATSFLLSGMAGGVWIVHAMLADRQEFYRRGQLDGWMKGWRGQPPDVDDPLLR